MSRVQDATMTRARSGSEGAADQPTYSAPLMLLTVGLVALATFLFFLQRNAFDASIGLIGAIATGLTGVFKVWDVIRTTKPQ